MKGMELAENIDQYKDWTLLEGEDSEIMVQVEKKQRKEETDHPGDKEKNTETE